MLNKENYVPWSSRLLRYAKSRPNGKLIHNSILNGPYVRRMIPEPGNANCEVTVTETFHVQTDGGLSKKEFKQIEADDQAIKTILLGLPEDIYAAIDSCETAQEIWFTSNKKESTESYYHHFLKLVNDLKRNKHFPEKIASNLKFLNNLQPEWSRHVTIVHQTKDLHTADYTQLYDFLKYNQKENTRVQNIRNQNGLIGVQRNENQNQIRNGNLVAARAERNAAGQNENQIRCYNCRGVASSESRPPMLNKENYVPWSFRLLRYAKSRPNGKLIHNFILNGPYVRKMIPEPGDANREITVTETFYLQTDVELSEKELKQIEADDQAIHTILLGLPEDIYASVDSCKTAQEIWLQVQQMMKGSYIGIQEKKAKLFNEWESQNGKEVDELKAERLAKTQDPLALMANSNNPYAFPAPHQGQPSLNQNYLQQPMPNPEDITDPTTSMNMALTLMAKAFKLKYSTPTNNNQIISSNPRNRQIAQPGMNMGQDRQMQMIGGNGGNQFRQYVGQNARNPNGYNDVIRNQNQIRNGNLVVARDEGNVAGQNGNQIPVLQLQGRIQLQAEEYDLMAAAADLDEIKKVNANCILMAKLQQASTSGTQTDSAPVYDIDESAEESGYSECCSESKGSECWKNQNGLIGVQGNVNQNQIGNGNLVAARAEGNVARQNGNQIRCYNCRGVGHYARNYTVRPRRRDAAYLQTQLLIVQKKEAGIQLQAEEYDLMAAVADLDEIEEVNANCILMANLQQASILGCQTDNAPVYNTDGSAEGHENYDDNEIFNMFTQEEHVEQGEKTVEQHPANFKETRALYESLYPNLAIEVEKVNSVNRKLKETNADLTTELARYKNQERCFEISQKKYDKLERCYQQFVYQEQCLSKKINALYLSTDKQIMTLNEQISELNKQLSMEKSNVSFLLKEKKRLKSDFKTYEDKLLDKQIRLEKKIKELNNIVLKMANVSKSFSIPNEDLLDDTTPSVARKFLNEVKNAIVTLQRIVKQRMTIETHNWASSSHQELHKIIRDENFPILNQVNARLQNFEMQFLKEAAKFVRDFKSLANEADASLAKNKALENAHLKATYKNLFDYISTSRAETQTIIASLKNELQSAIYKNAKLRTQLFKKVSDQKDNTCDTSANTKFAKQPIVENLPNVGKTHALSKPVTSNSVSTPQESKGVNNDKTSLRPEDHNLGVIQSMIGSPLRLRVVEARIKKLK
nr:hypothetical protein [Tanacetum cinerariifolium]